MRAAAGGAWPDLINPAVMAWASEEVTGEVGAAPAGMIPRLLSADTAARGSAAGIFNCAASCCAKSATLFAPSEILARPKIKKTKRRRGKSFRRDLWTILPPSGERESTSAPAARNERRPQPCTGPRPFRNTANHERPLPLFFHETA